MLTCMIVVSCTVLTHYRRLASSLRLPPHTLYSLSLVSHRFSSPDGCMFVYMEAQYVLVKTVIFSAKLSRVDRLPLSVFTKFPSLCLSSSYRAIRVKVSVHSFSHLNSFCFFLSFLVRHRVEHLSRLSGLILTPHSCPS